MKNLTSSQTFVTDKIASASPLFLKRVNRKTSAQDTGYLEQNIERLSRELRETQFLLQHITKQYRQAELNFQNLSQKLYQLATIDYLTDLVNRYSFETYLQREWLHLARLKAPLSLIICDVDYFKSYNDTYGHVAGDQCLFRVAQALKSQLKRPSDLGARYGGEEFAFVLPQTSFAGAWKVAEDMRLVVSELKLSHAQSLVSDRVSISLGLATVIPNRAVSGNILVKQADRALYQAKRQGRNCVKGLRVEFRI
jgi:diguanylate cyclase (GGDEF)-like protein